MSDLLKLMTCGSVDDGKSTLIGHMLYDARLLFTDQEHTLELESRIENQDGRLDYSLLLDGLVAEREQGITIDVAYRYFTTEKRSFIVADTPGHEEYTRNMAVAASFADAAVILVDATKGILTQTRRHVRICQMMGIRALCFVVNKMDLLQYREEEYRRIDREIRKLAVDLDLSEYNIIPVSATEGDNLTACSTQMPWFQGSPLLEYLENLEITHDDGPDRFVMPVQRVCRPNSSFRGFEGQIEARNISVGEMVCVLPSHENARVKAILSVGEPVKAAGKGEPVTLSLDREIDISRGCVITTEKALSIGNMFNAEIMWLEDEALYQGRNYLLKLGTQMIPASVMNIKHRIDINSGERIAASKLYKNDSKD